MRSWKRVLCVALIGLGAAGVGGAGAVSEVPPQIPITTVFLVRHAEKNPHPAGGDAGLSAKGQLRAAELARVLSGTHLDAIYSTAFGRARMTAETVARAQHDSVAIYDPEHPQTLVDRIRLQSGGAVLVVGHSDNLPTLYEALAGEPFPDGEDVPYDKLYILVMPSSGEHRLLTLRYGAKAE